MSDDRLNCLVVTDGRGYYRRQRNGFWTREATPTRRAHTCGLPSPPAEFGVESRWTCLDCGMEWTLRWVNDGSLYPGDRAAANSPSAVGSDGSHWVAFGRRNRRIHKRLSKASSR